jgi:hypothetical protein
MQIIRTPQRNDASLDFSVDGDVLTINGEAYDFSSIPEGGHVESVPCDWIVGPVGREGGEIVLTLIEPYGRPVEEADNVDA